MSFNTGLLWSLDMKPNPTTSSFLLFFMPSEKSEEDISLDSINRRLVYKYWNEIISIVP